LGSLFTHYKGIVGLLIGFAMMFVCRGISIWAIIKMAKTYVKYLNILVHMSTLK